MSATTSSTQNSSLALDLPEGKNDNGTNIQQWDHSGTFAQQFRIIAEEGGYCCIVSVGDEGKVISVASDTAADGTNVELQTYTSADNQLFKIVQNGSEYGFLSKCSGEKSALDVFEWSKENGANIAQYPYNVFDCQLFSVTPVYPKVNDGLYSLRRTSDSKVIGNRTIPQREDGKYTLTEADDKSGIYSIRCNADGSYTMISSDNQESTYVFEPVSEKASEPTQPPTTAPAPEKICGDVDANGEFNLLDVVMMQKYILGAGTLKDYEMGDLYEDGVLDVFDLVMMKRMLLNR